MSPAAGRRPRVAVVSPQEVVETGLRTMLERPGLPWEVVGPEAVDACVVLYDVIALHGCDGADLDLWLHQDEAVVVAIGRDLRPDLQALALDRGARAAIPLGVNSADLHAVVRAALTGRVEECPVVRLRSHHSPLGREVGLSTRESMVLRLIVQGYTNQEIADRLFLSINSIKTYIRTTYRKLDVGSRQAAVTWAIQHGFPIERDDDVAA